MILDCLFCCCFAIGTNSNEFAPRGLNLGVVLLQLTELRSAKRSPAAAVKDKNDVCVGYIISERVQLAVAIW